MKTLLSFLHVYSLLGANSFRSAGLLKQKTLLAVNYTSLMLQFGDNKCIMSMTAKALLDWQFSPSKLQQLPIDNIKTNYVRRNVKGAIFSEVLPTPLRTEVKLVDYSEDVLVNILDMNPAITESQDFVDMVAGNSVVDKTTPLAHRYGGHQFGQWASQLGDGRAILLGEYVNTKGERWELQLKGAGLTPYSRDGDGRAVLRSSVREFLASEACYYLGIPTSRAATIVVSNDPVIRDPLYTGSIQAERAAVVLRLAPSWFRFGSLEILAKTRELAELKKLTDFIIQEYYPEISLADENKYVEFYSKVAHLTIDLAVAWQSFGFAHGVLNTDNMSILGITIDYGPFGFVESYDPLMCPNASDREGRYCFEHQIEIAIWNLEKLSVALSPLVDESQNQQLITILQSLGPYSRNQLKISLRKKLGLSAESNDDNNLLMMLLGMMEESGGDFTMTFRQLAELPLADMNNEALLSEPRFWSLKRLYDNERWPMFVDLYRKRVEDENISDSERKMKMNAINPRYVLRNWMAQEAIQLAENDDFSGVKFVHRILRNPFQEDPDAERAGYAGPTPSWALRLKVSCSS